ncbi:hypothetical protein lerEdw1_014120, partial [Lerista edwardsae]
SLPFFSPVGSFRRVRKESKAQSIITLFSHSQNCVIGLWNIFEFALTKAWGLLLSPSFFSGACRKPAWKDGSTATCVLVIDNTLYIANLGDSRAILCRYNEESQKHTALSLSKEHNPTQYDERMRIQKAGGNVREGRVLGVLEVSRSIGDGQYKRFGVISVPDVKRCQLTHNDRFILLACDGLFKVFSPEEAVNFIVSCLEDKTLPSRDARLAVDARYEAACNRLANKAVQRGSADNVTVVVVRIEQ